MRSNERLVRLKRKPPKQLAKRKEKLRGRPRERQNRRLVVKLEK